MIKSYLVATNLLLQEQVMLALFILLLRYENSKFSAPILKSMEVKFSS